VTNVIYANEKYFEGFHRALSVVAQEKIYIEMIEAPPLEKVSQFQAELIAKNGPAYYAVANDEVVGWCDVFPEKNPRQCHRGGLGMGLLPAYRGQGLGSKLLAAVLDHAKSFGLEKVELHVYTSNISAIALYKKFGFEQEGLIQKYRKVDGQYFDCLAMGKFLRLQTLPGL
jgi:RimJ/RimL family protein N-acetyltransferase